MKLIYRLVHAQARRLAHEAIDSAPDGYVVEVKEPTRTLDQNADQWPYLEAFSKQLQWPINGVMSWLTADEWKDILTAAFNEEMVRVSPGLNGGMVMLGVRTSQMGKKRFSEWLEFLHATAAMRSVEPVYVSLPRKYREAA